MVTADPAIGGTIPIHKCLDNPELPACRQPQHTPAPTTASLESHSKTAMPTGAANTNTNRNHRDNDEDDEIDYETYFNCLGHAMDKRFCERPKNPADDQDYTVPG